MSGTYPVPTPSLEVFGNCSSCIATSTYGTTSPSALTNETWTMGTGYTSFPTAQQTTFPYNFFYIRDPADTTNEICMVILGGGGTSTWSVIRGVLSTTPVAHASGATWAQVVSNGTLQNFKQAPGAVITQAAISASTTETVLATYTPLATDIAVGATFAAISYGPVNATHGGATRPTIAFNLYWGGSGSVNGAFTATGSTLLASLKTGANMSALAATTVIAGASFDVNGELTLVSTTTAHANMNAWLAAGAALNTAALSGTSADTTTSGGASTAGPITISGSGPVILTCVWTAGSATVYGLTANSLIYRVA